MLPSLREILANNQSSLSECSPAKAQWQWCVSIAATEQLLLKTLATASPDVVQGLVLAAPAPVFSDARLTQSLQTITLTAKPFNPLALMPFEMTVAAKSDKIDSHQESVLPLAEADPLAREQFCLVFTNQFSIVLVLAEDNNGDKEFLFSFEPEIVQQAWQALGARIMVSNPDLFAQLEELVQKYFPGAAPDYRTVMLFSQLLLTQLPEQYKDMEIRGHQEVQKFSINPHPSVRQFYVSCLQKEDTDKVVASAHHNNELRKLEVSTVPCVGAHRMNGSKLKQPSVEEHLEDKSSPNPESRRADVELVQAFAHEIRTPLTTIRTITRLLLKRRDLPAKVINRLELIDHECTQQIDRMELLFRAAELETSASVKCVNSQLTAMSLEQVFKQSIPRWEQAALKRNLTLDVILPQQLPMVVSNPAMLDQVLTGLMENFTRSLPAGSRIQVQVIPAGDQLKLQLMPLPAREITDKDSAPSCVPPIRKALGQLLIFQPETGTISLNLNVTKHLFQAIGGKLIVRERPRYGEVLTIFLPLEVNNQHKWQQPL
jgi:nitrogen-specific signal transduction histidine kinase